jgi:renalase
MNMSQKWDYIIVGAGMSGAVCASRLASDGASVLVIDKARGSGGRLASKRLGGEGLPGSYDLGAQSFECSTARFKDFLGSLDSVRFIADRPVRLAVGEGRNSAVTRSLLNKVEVSFSTRVNSARQVQNGDGADWNLICERGGEEVSYRAQHLILATPPIQAADILGSEHCLFESLSAVEHEAQWVMMLASEENFERSSNIASDVLESVSADSLKRSAASEGGAIVWVLHATEEWTRDNLDLEKQSVAEQMLQAFNQSCGSKLDLGDASILTHHVHRWLYARPKLNSRIDAAFYKDSSGLMLCGDYFNNGSEYGVESAFLSASLLCDQLFCD